MKVLCALSLALTLLLFAGVVGCGDRADPPTPDLSTLTSPGVLPNAAAPLVTPTYDGSDQTVEPTVLEFPGSGWRGHRYWMAVSPYPYEHYLLENPSILVSEDGLHWSVPQGLQNPIALPVLGYLADATVVYDDASDQLWVYFLNDVADQERLLRKTSSDGIHWSPAQIVLTGPVAFVNSPSVTKVDGRFFLWAVNTPTCQTQTSVINVRVSDDGVNWSGPTPLQIDQPGYVLWHVNTIRVEAKGQWMSLVAAYKKGLDCAHTILFFANSYDGIHWKTYSDPILTPAPGWDGHQIYRSSLLYDLGASRLRVWYSAESDTHPSSRRTWHVGYTEKKFPIQ